VINYKDLHDAMYWQAVQEYEHIMPALVVFGNLTGVQLVLFSIRRFSTLISVMSVQRHGVG